MLEQYDLHNLLVIDIETVPQYSNFDQVPEHFQKLWDAKNEVSAERGNGGSIL